LGYPEVNLNLGCPYPMVAKRKKGSGLIAFPQEIKYMLQSWFENPPIKLSIKLRLGYENKDEIYPVLDVLNCFPLDEIILHPRIGKNLYKGRADTEAFAQALEYSNHPITYNGDIDSAEKFRKLSEEFPTIDNWMIGRGILCNTFFVEEIKQLKPKTDMEKKIRMKNFIEELWQAYEDQYGHPSQALNKMKQHWIYLSQWFSNPHKVYKMIKKSNSEYKYKERVGVIFKECD
ncbi:MAG: tRNA-dihydrouridine synthase family protein, partial [Bacteroidota bacterium]|nr:tRNA-dihydrouridine synthase family protein [Bacteroidota bacterium]